MDLAEECSIRDTETCTDLGDLTCEDMALASSSLTSESENADVESDDEIVAVEVSVKDSSRLTESDILFIQKRICKINGGVGSITCSLHNLHNCIKDGLKLEDFAEIVKKCSSIVRKGRQCILVMQSLREVGKNLKKHILTRWSTALHMLKSVADLTDDEIEVILRCGKRTKKSLEDAENMRLDECDQMALSELVEILECINKVILALQFDGVTISKVFPEIHGLRKRLNELNLQVCDHVRTALLHAIDKRFDYLDNEHLYGICTLLDPNYGKYAFKRAELQSWIMRLVVLLDKEVADVNELSVNAVKTVGSKLKSSASWLVDEYDNVDDENTHENMVKRYLDSVAKPTNNYVDVYAFWNLKKHEFPLLATLAKRYLSILAGTQSIERAFSMTGFIVRKHRQNLSDKNAENYFF